MLGRDGTKGRLGRGGLVGGTLLAAVLAGCGASPGGEEAAAFGTEEDADSSTATEDDGQSLTSRDYDPGDCVMWEVDESTMVDTRLVDCTEPHQIQITGEHLMPYSAEYPAPEAWDALHTAECATIAAEYLGHPIDPYGRFAVQTIIPQPEAWAASDRTVWCGIGGWVGPDGQTLVTEDVRTADHSFHWNPGECLTNMTGLPVVAACDQPHQREVAGRADFGDLAAAPSDADLEARCTAIIDTYVGGQLAPPWGYTWDHLSAESWAAGRRTAHCMVGQMDEAGNEVEMTAPVVNG